MSLTAKREEIVRQATAIYSPVRYWAIKYRNGCPADEIPIEMRESVTVWLLEHRKPKETTRVA